MPLYTYIYLSIPLSVYVGSIRIDVGLVELMYAPEFTPDQSIH